MNTRQWELSGGLLDVCKEGRVHEAYPQWDAYLRPWLTPLPGVGKPAQPYEEPVTGHAP
jgi:hypothetical protein